MYFIVDEGRHFATLQTVSSQAFQAQKFDRYLTVHFLVARGLSVLTDITVRKAKAAAKPYMMGDGKGLHLFVIPADGKSWRMD